MGKVKIQGHSIHHLQGDHYVHCTGCGYGIFPVSTSMNQCTVLPDDLAYSERPKEVKGMDG